MSTRNLVDADILPLLDMPLLDLKRENLQSLRTDAAFQGSDVPPPSCPIVETFAKGRDGAPDVRLVVIDPPSRRNDRGAILYFHGGGMVLGSADMVRAGWPDDAGKLDCVIVSVDYRLAPETPFPGPQEDAYAALEWLVANAATLGVDPARVIVVGESAGGGLAASLAIMTRDRGGPFLAGQILLAPMLDYRVGGEKDPWRNRGTGEYVWTRSMNQFGWNCIRGNYDPSDDRKGWFSPALADDFANLPPSYVATGALDLFFDENVHFARCLVDAHVSCELHVYPGAVHAFGWLPEALISMQAKADLIRVLRRFLSA